MLKPAAFASAFLLAAATLSFAADLPQRYAPPAPIAAPVFTWSGFYLGTSTGGIALEGDVRTSGNAANTAADILAARRPSSLALHDGESLLSSAQLGFNAQFGSFVTGLEADASLVDASAKAVYNPLNGPSVFRQDLDGLATVRGRAGVASHQVLVYGTVGAAIGTVRSRGAFLRSPDFAFEHIGSRRDTQAGYVVGGGVEFVVPQALQQWALLGRLLGATNMTVKAEYLYFDLGSRDVTMAAVPGVGLNGFRSRFETSGHIGRIGFNYRFGT